MGAPPPSAEKAGRKQHSDSLRVSLRPRAHSVIRTWSHQRRCSQHQPRPALLAVGARFNTQMQQKRVSNRSEASQMQNEMARETRRAMYERQTVEQRAETNDLGG